MLDSYSPKWFEEPPHEAQFADPPPIDPKILEILNRRGIKKLYSHQKKAIEAIREGKNIVLMAPTASGKTECYMIPVVEAAMRGESSLLIFPTKALSRDQWSRIREFMQLGVRAEVYDGDTAQGQRQKIRNRMPQVLITNFDMLHYMLGNLRIWNEFFYNLRYVVVDEVHAYSGTLGSHVANVLWRLKRVLQKKEEWKGLAKGKTKQLSVGDFIELDPSAAKAPGGKHKLQFIVSSATIGNAPEFASKICSEKEFVLIEGTGSPRGKTMHAVISERDESVVTTSLKVAKEINRKTIIFGNSHNMVERLGMVGRRIGMDVAVYRSGLPSEDRRNLEAGFHSGRVNILAATSALELGMDVGNADAAILAGFPGTVTRLRQRIGRVGRKGQDSYAVLVARDNPLDQYYAANPEVYLLGKPESCNAKPDNPFIRSIHLLSAARDIPLDEGDLHEGDEKLVRELMEKGLLHRLGDMIIPTPEGTQKIRTLSLRNCVRQVRILDKHTKKQMGEREESIAISELFPGAIYLIGGKRYVSRGLDLDEAVAYLEPAGDDDTYHTQATRTEHAEVIGVEEERYWNEVKLTRGSVHITHEVNGFVVKDSLNGQSVGRRELDEPLVYEFDTQAFWADWDYLANGTASFGEGLHALEHVSIGMMPALSGADAAEVGGISNPYGRIFYYEGSAGGSGVSEIVFKRYAECIRMAYERLKACPCKKGCPSCIFSPQCGNNNRYLDKDEAIKIAKDGLGEK